MKIAFLLLILLVTACSPKVEQRGERILSLAPSITELLYRYEVNDKIIGFTDHCIVPDGVDKNMSIGSMTPSLEAILAKKPSLLFTSNNRPEVQNKLIELGIKVEKVNVLTFEDSMKSFKKIGKMLGKQEKADELIKECREQLEGTIEAVNSGEKTVMLSISTLYDQPGKASPWIAGQKNLYTDLLNRFKVKNAYQGEKPYLKISTESLIQLNPDVVIILKHFKMKQEIIDKELAAWKEKMPYINAVKNNHIYILGADYMMLTGPRIPLIIKDFEVVLTKAFK